MKALLRFDPFRREAGGTFYSSLSAREKANEFYENRMSTREIEIAWSVLAERLRVTETERQGERERERERESDERARIEVVCCIMFLT